MTRGLKRSAQLSVAALALVGLTACQQPEAAIEESPRLVRVITVAVRDHPTSASLTGEVQALTKIDLAFRVAGQISELNVTVGQHVTAGQILAHIDSEAQQADLELAKASVQAAEAALEQASAALVRQQALLASGLVTRSKYDQAEQDRRTAESSLVAAQAMHQAALNALSYTELLADGDGIVTRINRDKGEIAASAQPVISIAHDGPRDAVFNVHESLLFADAEELQAVPVDIALVAMMGGLCVANGDADALGFGPACKPSAVPLGATAFKLHDAVDQAVVPLLAGFPYLNTPLPGSR